jgi:hypothetical protein
VWRVARDTNTDTPLPPDEPFFVNAPNGATLDYVLPATAAHVTITVRDARGATMRTLSNAPIAPVDPTSLDSPEWWIAPPVTLDATAGAHRVTWDLHLASPHALGRYPTIAAIPYDTPLQPQGARVPPGMYAVTLDVDGVRSTRSLTVRQDPRVPIPQRDLEAQFAFAAAIGATIDITAANVARVPALARLNSRLSALLDAVESGDGAPTAVQRAYYDAARADVSRLLAPRNTQAPRGKARG